MSEKLSQTLVQKFAGLNILVLGDVMLDRFIYGKSRRISPEAPVPVLAVTHERLMPGGAANVARNIAALGGSAHLIGVAGDDPAGEELSGALSEISGIRPDPVIAPGRPTTLKTRLVAESQQMLRVDRETTAALPEDVNAALMERFRAALPECDMVILSDYAKGVLSETLVKACILHAHAAGKAVIIDPKHTDVARYDGAGLITPNLAEAQAMTGISGSDAAAVEAMAADMFMKAPHLTALVITRGGDGMSLQHRGEAMVHMPVTAREVADVSGAGDTVVAALALSLAAGAGAADAVHLANCAAGIVVGKLGTAVVHPDELSAALTGAKMDAMQAKSATRAEAVARAARWREEGLKVGFTNGCFDLVHPGHISLLQQAKSHCDRLIVGLNTDASVKRLKGPERPVQSEVSRAVVLGALEAVDLVVLFDEDTPKDLIEAIVPDVLVKGADYTAENVVGADFVRAHGGKLVLARLMDGQSTTSMIRRSHSEKFKCS